MLFPAENEYLSTDQPIWLLIKNAFLAFYSWCVLYGELGLQKKLKNQMFVAILFSGMVEIWTYFEYAPYQRKTWFYKVNLFIVRGNDCEQSV
jgi:hypothetical protein